jgi:hypothetical protein
MIRAAAAIAVIASAADAYVQAPLGLRMSASRREVVQAGATAAAIAPFVQTGAASASMDKSGRAPVVTIFDHRGCGRATKEYTGAKSGDKNDQMCIKAQSLKISVSEQTAAKLLQEALSQMKNF